MKKENDRIEVERGRITYKKFDTAMDYLQDVIDEFRKIRVSKDEIPFSDCLIPAKEIPGVVRYYQVKKILDTVRQTRAKIKEVQAGDNDLTAAQKYEICSEIENDCIDHLKNMAINEKTMRHIFSLIDKPENSDVKTYIFNTMFRLRHPSLGNLIKISSAPMFKLKEDPNGDICIYDLRFSLVPASKTYKN